VRQLHREHRIRVVERDDQCVIVLDLQAGQLRVIADIRVLQFVVALDDGHAARLLHGVLDVRRIAPGIGEGTGGNGLAVGEFPAVVDYDGELRSVIVRRDRLGDFEMLLAVHVIADQTLKQVTDDLAATHFVGVGGNQRALRLGVVDGNDGFSRVYGRAGIGLTTAGGHGNQHHTCCCHGGETFDRE